VLSKFSSHSSSKVIGIPSLLEEHI
jgi:hypothetical protein